MTHENVLENVHMTKLHSLQTKH